MSERTVRELTGEIWAEINNTLWKRGDDFDIDVLNEFLDIARGVLARHDGSTIIHDPDMPVDPLPKQP